MAYFLSQFSSFKSFCFSLIFSFFMPLWLIITLTFILMKILPGDPFATEQALPKNIHLALKAHYGLEDPWYRQYGQYLKSSLSGDFGPSFRYQGQNVSTIIAYSFPISATLGLEVLFLAISLGITLGTLSAYKTTGLHDTLFVLMSAFLISIPSFLLAPLLQYSFGLKWSLLPIARWGSFSHTLLPCFSLAAFPIAYIARLTRANLIDVLQQNYIRTARLKGLSTSSILFFHALPNALIPLLSYLGPLSANILIGSFVVEKIFAIPGLGQWFIASVLNRDYTMIMGLTVFYSAILLSLIFITDCLYRYLDPRLSQIQLIE